jgi:hypothetical protein
MLQQVPPKRLNKLIIPRYAVTNTPLFEQHQSSKSENLYKVKKLLEN